MNAAAASRPTRWSGRSAAAARTGRGRRFTYSACRTARLFDLLDAARANRRSLPLAAGSGQDAADDLVVRDVLLEPDPQPVVPHLAPLDLHVGRLFEGLGVVPGNVRQLGRPDGRVPRAGEEFVDLLRQLVARLVGEETADLGRRRQGPGHVDRDSAEELFVRGRAGRRHAEHLELGVDFPVDEVHRRGISDFSRPLIGDEDAGRGDPAAVQDGQPGVARPHRRHLAEVADAGNAVVLDAEFAERGDVLGRAVGELRGHPHLHRLARPDEDVFRTDKCPISPELGSRAPGGPIRGRPVLPGVLAEPGPARADLPALRRRRLSGLMRSMWRP